jgi:uncharacterized protein YecT (DUF1311 family)
MQVRDFDGNEPPPGVTSGRSMWTRLALILGLAMTAVANAASFPCGGKLSTQEQLICADKRLSALDYRLDALYKMALDVTEPKESLRTAQRSWLKSDRAKCSDAVCLLSSIQRRNDELMTLIKQHSTPFDNGISVAVHHAATETAGYCERGDDVDWFSVSVAAEDDLISGTIDGIFNCGQKIWGPIDVEGKKLGNVVLVKFNPSFSDENAPLGEAMIVVSHDRVYWRILSDVEVESYVPRSEVIALVQ